MFSESQKRDLLNFARAVIRNKLDGSAYLEPQESIFQEKRGIFVSLHKDSQLRGCIGYIFPYKNLLESTREMAIAAAFRDPRFSPLSLQEFAGIEIEISILSELQPVKSIEDIEIGRDGLYLEHPDGSGLLLPQVATEYRWSVGEFLIHLCYKAGLQKGAYKYPEAMLYRFSADVFSTG